MDKKLMLIRVDAGPDIGSGHFMRTLAIAQEWYRRGNNAIFLSSNLPSVLAEHLQNKFALISLGSPPGTRADAMETGHSALDWGARCMVIDGYQFDTEYQNNIPQEITQLFIDDVGHCEEYFADIILNQNLHATKELYQNSLPETELLLGLRYVVLRNQFKYPQNKLRPTSSIVSTILITLGGSDSSNLIGKISYDVLEQGAPNLKVIMASKIKDMAKTMLSVDMAISGGGTTVWELAYMGVPSICISNGKQEEILIAAAADQHMVIDGGRIDEIGTDKFNKTITNLIYDPKRRRKLSQRSRALVDGKGTERVIDVILENIKHNVER